MISTIYSAIKDLITYFSPRILVGWRTDIRGNKLIIVNTSEKTAFNVTISYDENLFWYFPYIAQRIDGGAKVEVKFTRITASSRTGYIYIKWTNEKGNKEYVYKHQLNFS